jgi:hypothetical protein
MGNSIGITNSEISILQMGLIALELCMRWLANFLEIARPARVCPGSEHTIYIMALAGERMTGLFVGSASRVISGVVEKKITGYLPGPAK